MSRPMAGIILFHAVRITRIIARCTLRAEGTTTAFRRIMLSLVGQYSVLCSDNVLNGKWRHRARDTLDASERWPRMGTMKFRIIC